MTHQQKSSKIRKEVISSYNNIKERYPILKHQNFWGFLIFMLSIASVALVSTLWWNDILPTWAMVLFNAFCFGILHELEHDLIHWMYFKNNKFVHHLMLLTVWLLRPMTINPWIRRTLHYHHHKFSGTVHDVEERGVSNGEKWSLKRLFLTADLVIGGLTRVGGMFHDIKREVSLGNLKFGIAKKLKLYAVLGLVPITIIAHVLLYIFFADTLLIFLDNNFQTGLLLPAFLSGVIAYCTPVIYIILLPNLLRQFCLHFITSNLHYYGDVENGNVIEQTQVLTVWWTLPFQLFCFFFGWTHAIHHFVVNETFYIRHITRRKAHDVMKAYGVRFNDLGTFSRANRFHKQVEKA